MCGWSIWSNLKLGRRGMIRQTSPRRMTTIFLGLAALLLSYHLNAQEDVDPDAISKAEQLMEASHSMKLADQMIVLMEAPLLNLLQSVNPGREEMVGKVLRDRVLPEMRRRLPEFRGLAARVYAQHFTVGELDQLIAFYESPIGQRLVAEQPAMLTEMTRISQVWAQNLATEVLRKLAPEIESQGLKMPNI